MNRNEAKVGESEGRFKVATGLPEAGTDRKMGETHGISNPLSPRLLPLKKAAEYLGLTTWGMRERIWAGDIPVVRFPGGRKMFVDRMDIENFIRSNKTTL